MWDFSGATNLDELQDTLRRTLMIRRLKQDVLKELPPKTRQIVVLQQNGATKQLQQEQPIVTELQHLSAVVDAAALLGDADEYANAVLALDNHFKASFELFSMVRHETALAKAPYAIQHIRDALEDNTHKIVVFCHHQDVIDLVMEGLAEFGTVKVDGRDTMENRQASVDRFQQDPGCRVFVGNMMAAGTGLTLTAAAHVVFVELDWVPGVVEQASDRCHRIGQQHNVLIQHLVFENSIDLLLAETLVRKQQVIDRALDIQHSDSTAADAIKAADPHTPNVALVSVDRKAAILKALQQLSGTCDGARRLDGFGFNRLHAVFGKKLAASAELTDRQAHAAIRMLQTYRYTQIPSDLVALIWP